MPQSEFEPQAPEASMMLLSEPSMYDLVTLNVGGERFALRRDGLFAVNKKEQVVRTPGENFYTSGEQDLIFVGTAETQYVFRTRKPESADFRTFQSAVENALATDSTGNLLEIYREGFPRALACFINQKG